MIGPFFGTETPRPPASNVPDRTAVLRASTAASAWPLVSTSVPLHFASATRTRGRLHASTDSANRQTGATLRVATAIIVANCIIKNPLTKDSEPSRYDCFDDHGKTGKEVSFRVSASPQDNRLERLATRSAVPLFEGIDA